jgi:hypothetical protein
MLIRAQRKPSSQIGPFKIQHITPADARRILPYTAAHVASTCLSTRRVHSGAIPLLVSASIEMLCRSRHDTACLIDRGILNDSANARLTGIDRQ